jgi:hypothetical protein
MASAKDSGSNTEKTSPYIEELNARHARFVALGGGKDLQMEMKGWTPLKDLVTDQHRHIVFDLSASGLSNEDVAAVVGISKERLQELFKVEIATAYQLCHASLSRSLYYQGIAGDEKAATNWLKYHNRSKWAAKQQLAGTPDGEAIKVEETSSKSLLNALLQGMLTDPDLKGSTKERKQPKSDAKAPAKATKPGKEKLKVIKKLREEDDEK